MKLLHVDSSILGGSSATRKVAAGIVESSKAGHPGVEVTYRDLAAAPIGHLSGAHLAGQRADVEHDQALQEDLDLGGRALAEFLDADVVVIGAPMYSFTVPSQLRAWVDRVLVAGKTFRYTASGSEGLVPGERVILAPSRGGPYENTPKHPMEHGETWLKVVSGFMGITDVESIRAEGVAHGPDQREASPKAALGEAEALRAA